LQVGITLVGTGLVDTMFIGDDLPELATNLVSALTSLAIDFLIFDF